MRPSVRDTIITSALMAPKVHLKRKRSVPRQSTPNHWTHLPAIKITVHFARAVQTFSGQLIWPIRSHPFPPLLVAFELHHFVYVTKVLGVLIRLFEELTQLVEVGYFLFRLHASTFMTMTPRERTLGDTLSLCRRPCSPKNARTQCS